MIEISGLKPVLKVQWNIKKNRPSGLPDSSLPFSSAVESQRIVYSDSGVRLFFGFGVAKQDMQHIHIHMPSIHIRFIIVAAFVCLIFTPPSGFLLNFYIPSFHTRMV